MPSLIGGSQGTSGDRDRPRWQFRVKQSSRCSLWVGRFLSGMVMHCTTPPQCGAPRAGFWQCTGSHPGPFPWAIRLKSSPGRSTCLTLTCLARSPSPSRRSSVPAVVPPPSPRPGARSLKNFWHAFLKAYSPLFCILVFCLGGTGHLL